MVTKKTKSPLKQKPLKKRLHFAFSKKKSKDTFSKQNKERIEILDFEENTKYEKRRIKLKLHFKNKFRFSFACLMIVVLLLTSTSLITGKNVVKVGVKKVLNSVGIYTEEIKSVEIQSTDYDQKGSWHIDKSAEWTGKGTAKVTFDVNSIMKTTEKDKDIILVLDMSGSMEGDRLKMAIKDSKELVDYLLTNKNNKVAIVTFNTTSTIVSNFSDNKEELLQKLEGIIGIGSTNYNDALKNVATIMNGYIKEENREVRTLFLTDGLPNEDTPNQIGTYTILKEKYPYMKIDGIQYEMGSTIVEELKQISDSQWASDGYSLNNVLFDIAVSPIPYEKFIVTDYIHENFKVDSEKDIKVTKGEVSLEEENGIQKIVWNLGKETYRTGRDAKMEIDLTLKPQYVGEKGFYPTNQKENITYKLPNEQAQIVNSNVTPVLRNTYDVIYDTNTPTSCTLEDIPKESYAVYQNVAKKTDELSCQGYLFKGWEIDDRDEADIKKLNDDIFIMPNHDVTLRATWTKQAISKSMEGTVHEKTTLYSVLQTEATSGGLALEYTGKHKDSMDTSKSTEKIYHYYATTDEEGTAIQNKNNVIFAGHCWQMIRTTDTGGVKMIYNGEVENGKCLNTRGVHPGFREYKTSFSVTTQAWKETTYFATNYTYDANTKTFKLAGTKFQLDINDMTSSNLIGKYTCVSSTESGNCKAIYLIESYDNNTQYAVASIIEPNSNYSQFGISQFNDIDIYNYGGSPADVGYKYGDRYVSESETEFQNEVYLPSEQEMLLKKSLDMNAIYADSVEYDATTGQYSLVNPHEISQLSDKPNLAEGKYIIPRDWSSTGYPITGNTVYYIVKVTEFNQIYYKPLKSGEKLSDYSSIVLGDDIIMNTEIQDDGTHNISYELKNTKTVSLEEWCSKYYEYKGMYTCGNNNTICTTPGYITSTDLEKYETISVSQEKILIAKNRNGMKLLDTLLVRIDDLLKNRQNYSDYKYTCNTSSDICTESTLRMIDKIGDDRYTYVLNRYYGSKVKWNGTSYILEDPIEIENYNNINQLSTHHYMCLEPGTKSCEKVAYIYQFGRSTGNYLTDMFYITLSEGVDSVEKVLENMLTKNVNDSIIKTNIDAWYENYLKDYSDYLEDTIFCNNRKITDLGGWNSNGGKDGVLLFEGYMEGVDPTSTAASLECSNITDQFSVSNEKAKLKYKVGLISGQELNLLNNKNALKTGDRYWADLPQEYGSGSINFVIDTDGRRSSWGGTISASNGIRPAISLIPKIGYSEGDGSMEHPYVVDVG